MAKFSELNLTSQQRYDLSTIKNAGAMNSALKGVYERMRKQDMENVYFDFYATLGVELYKLEVRKQNSKNENEILLLSEAIKHIIDLLPIKYKRSA